MTQNGPIVLNDNITTGVHHLTLGAAATLSGAGEIIGTARRVSPASHSALFFNNVPTTFNFATAPTQMDVKLTKSAPPNATAAMLARTYTLTPTGSAAATVCLGYQGSELSALHRNRPAVMSLGYERQPMELPCPFSEQQHD